MRFLSAILFRFVFAQSFFKFHKNGDIRKLKACSFRLWKNDFRRLYNERARALQSSITFFLIHPVECNFMLPLLGPGVVLSIVQFLQLEFEFHRPVNQVYVV